MSIKLVPTTREAVDSFLVLGGVVIVVVQVLALAYSRIHMAVVAVGIMMIYSGVLRLGSHVMPNRRIYTQLRSEVDHFIQLIRELNSHAVSGDSQLFSRTRAAMLESVDRITAVAGVTDKQSSEGKLHTRPGLTSDHKVGSLQSGTSGHRS